ncbi:MAG: Peptidylprolyl isomerase domain and WD repeat containing protein 1, partial [Paramarteilia canceri]
MVHAKSLANDVPTCSVYESSLMHRFGSVEHVLACSSTHLVSASDDGVLKFWRKPDENNSGNNPAKKSKTTAGATYHTLETENIWKLIFLREYRAHKGQIKGLCLTPDRSYLITFGKSDNSLKLFDASVCDMLAFIRMENAEDRVKTGTFIDNNCFVYTTNEEAKETKLRILEISNIGQENDDTSESLIDIGHYTPIEIVAFNIIFGIGVSSDSTGVINFWKRTNSENFCFPSEILSFECNSDTDLVVFLSGPNIKPLNIVFTPDGTKMICVCSDLK